MRTRYCLMIGLMAWQALSVALPVWADTPPALPLTSQQIAKLQQIFPSTTQKNNNQDEENHFTWQGDPLKIALPLNQEKRLIFPEKVVPDLKGALTTEQLRILNDNQSLYLTALKPFPVTRLFVTLENSHDVILMDLVTRKDASNATAIIGLKQPRSPTENASITTQIIHNPSEDNTHDDAALATATDADTWVALTRFAWQQLYAPPRLLSNPLGITRTPMHTLNLLATLVYGDKVYAHPLASWQYQGSYLTAVVLRNKYPHATVINLAHDLCGNWAAAALYPRRQLKPAGEKDGDSAVVLLISRQPFSDSMEVCNDGA